MIDPSAIDFSGPLPGGGDRDEDYRLLREDAGLVDAPWEGLYEITGRDRCEFLQALLTADLRAVVAGRCVPAGQADRKGRSIADLWVLGAPGRLLLRVSRERWPPLSALFDHHRVGEDVAWRELPVQRTVLLAGARAAEAAAAAGVPYEEGRVEGGEWQARDGSEKGIWMRIRETSPAEFLLAVTSGATGGRQALEDRRTGATLPPPAGWHAFNLRRIEAGSAWFGLDAGEDRLLPEWVREDRISYAKGCYLGQETIARLHHLGRRNWILGRLRIDAGAVPPPSTPILAGGLPAGRGAGGMEGEVSDDVFDGAAASPAQAGWTASGALHPDGTVRALGFVHRRVLNAPPDLRLAGGEVVHWLGPPAPIPGM